MVSLILLEDEPVLREELGDFLATAGHQVTTAGTIAQFRQGFHPARHHIAIVDLGLPDGDGMTLVGELRAAQRQLGIIVLTARGTIEHKLSGLAGGADYYLSKTADLAELAATVAALARRLNIEAQPAWVLQGSPRQLVPPGAPPIALSGQDHAVLLALATGGDCVTREAIVTALGGDFFQYDQRRMDTQMRRLRRKVEEACGLQLPVTTLRGIGYRFHDPIVVQR